MNIQETQLKISETALIKLQQLLQNKPTGTFLRVEVTPGGCQGFSVKFTLNSKLEPKEDAILQKNNTTIVCDTTSLSLIEGSTIEYSSSLMGSYFWLNIAKAKSTCSCGSSFSV